jgi:group I intron endonuclease
MNASGIYLITRSLTGQVYVGSAVCIRSRWHRHRFDLRHGRHHSTKLQRAWNKDGGSGFVFSVLLVCAPSDLLFYEQRALDRLDGVGRGFNMSPTAGNSLGTKHSDEARRKMSQASAGNQNRLGAPCLAETRAKIGAKNRGRRPSADVRSKLSVARKGNQNALGFVHTPEARAAMSASRSGKAIRPEVLAARIGRKHVMSDQGKANIRAAAQARRTRGACPPEVREKIRQSHIARVAAKVQQQGT